MFQFILLLLVPGVFSAPKPQDTYGAPAAPGYSAPAADTYGSPAAPAVDSYGAPRAPVCRTEQSPTQIPGAQCDANAPQCVDQVLVSRLTRDPFDSNFSRLKSL